MILDLCSCPALHSLLYHQCSGGGAYTSPCLHACLCCSSFPSHLRLTAATLTHRPAHCTRALQLSSALLQEAFQDLCHQAPSQCVTCACHPSQVLRAGLCSILTSLGFASVLCLLGLSTVLLQCESFVEPKIQFRVTHHYSCSTTLICVPLVQGHTCDTRTTILYLSTATTLSLDLSPLSQTPPPCS